MYPYIIFPLFLSHLSVFTYHSPRYVKQNIKYLLKILYLVCIHDITHIHTHDVKFIVIQDVEFN